MLRAVAFLWGFLEATVFFLVPDVYLTGVVLKADSRKILVAFFYSLSGALLGGVILYAFAFSHPLNTLDWFDHIPGISTKLIQNVRVNISAEGLTSMFKGMFQGVPYKLFAAAWGEKGGDLSLFIFLTIVARGSRFIFSILVAAFLKILGTRFVKKWNTWRWVVYSMFWSIFYTVYFYYMHNKS